MKLNCDLGESFGAWRMGQDETIMPHIDMANIACGFHAGDPNVMYQTLLLAKRHRVSVGAHPGYPDLQGFGRRPMELSPEEIKNLVLYQVGALSGIAAAFSRPVEYVKPHGALYHDMMQKPEVADALFEVMALLNQNADGKQVKPMALVLQATAENDKWRARAQAKAHANTHAQAQASPSPLPLMFEAFADRGYDNDGQLLSRHENGALLQGEALLEQVRLLNSHGQVRSAGGRLLSLEADTLCIHGDHSDSVSQIKGIRALCQA